MIRTRLDIGGIDLDGTLRVLAMLPGDPTLRLERGRLQRATQTPDGPVTIAATWTAGATTVEVTTCGPGAEWSAIRSPELLGVADHHADDFEPPAGPVRELWRRRRGLRVPRTATVWHDLCWLVVQQRIQRIDAAQQWRRFVRRFGSPAPGDADLLVPPSRERLAAVPYHDLHEVGIERRRADTLRAAARSTIDLQRLIDRPAGDAASILHTVPGIGHWTTSTLSAITWGDPDAVIVGDSGIPALVSWVVAARRTSDDEQMLALLAPFRPHRYRVIQLAVASGRRPPRRHPHRQRIDIARR